MSDLALLQNRIKGAVRLDQTSRLLYSTDASSYQIMPAGVVIPRHVDDVMATVQFAKENSLSIVPRGGGTSLSGQTIGAGIIIDHSRHLDQIVEINPQAKWVKVQAGLVLDHLNRALLPHGLMVGPDPASSMAATLGGMTGNNSTGTHSIKYGMMVDHVREVEVILSDGNCVTFGAKTPEEVAYLSQQPTLEGQLYRDIPRLIEQYREDILTRYPKTWRNVAGYNLNRMLRQMSNGESFNLAPLIVGSEGTLGIISAIKLNLVARPQVTRLVILHFDSLRESLASVPQILEHQPAAIELMDRFFTHLTWQTPEYGPRLSRFVEGDPRALLIVEFAGETDLEIAAQASKLEKALRAGGYQGVMVHCTTPEAIANVWTVRKAGLGLLMSQRGDAKPLAFVDDATVPIETLADYAEAVEQACEQMGTTAAFYAHASAGCLHINPVIDLKTAVGLAQMQEISQTVARLAIHYGGTTTGEHGEGLARSYFNQQLYGERLHQAFREVKGLFDPANRFNPGKIIDAPAPWQPDNLRYQPGYATPYAPINTFLDFTSDGGFAGLVEMCNGQGVCRKRENGVMCPSFMATREEAHSTRGRANTLRAAMTGELGAEGLASHALHEVLDLCLECKACQRECPSLVDMAKLKYEFLAHYQAVHGVPWRSRLFAKIARLNWLGSHFTSLTNWTFRNQLFRWVLDRGFGIDRRRELPPLAPQTFRQWFKHRPQPRNTPQGEVVLWDDTYLLYNEPQIGQAAVKILEAVGYKVTLIQNRQCCGRPMISKGLLEQAKANAIHNVNLLLPYVEAGIPVVGIEPSCVAAFRDEYPALVKTELARQVAAGTYFIEEFLVKLAMEGKLPIQFTAQAQNVLVHGHCHQKAITGTGDLLRLLNLLPDVTVSEINSGCCGMAGAFGYEKEHYAVSLTCGEDRLFPTVRAATHETVIVAPGTSCRHQIAHGTARQVLHPLEVLAARLETRPPETATGTGG